jgi:hypothetical protein
MSFDTDIHGHTWIMSQLQLRHNNGWPNARQKHYRIDMVF